MNGAPNTPSLYVQPTKGLRSIAMTIALRVALATALVCVCVFTLVYAGLVHQTRAALQATVDTDLAGLVDIYHDQKIDGLTARLQERLDLAPTAGERPLYILLDKDGKALIGKAAQWPALQADLSEAGILNVGKDRVLARVTQLRGGLKLLVGRSMSLGDATLADVRLLFIVAILLMVVAAFFIGNFAARRLRSRVTALNNVFDAARDGDFRARADITRRSDELDSLGDHVNETLERVERLLTAQREVSDNIAHEIRTPLTALNARIETALSLCDDPEAVTALQAAQEEVRGTLRLLDALLDIASVEAQRGDMRALSDVDLSALAHSLTELYAASAEEAGLDLVADIADGIVIRADAMQMSRLLVNLLDNALKYGQSGKTIHFTLKDGPVIILEDDGPGVPDADKLRVFDRYHRGSNVAGKVTLKGHGLGLALVASIAARHNLVIRVEDSHPDAVNKGARFIIKPMLAGPGEANA